MKVYISKMYWCSKCRKWLGDNDVHQEVVEKGNTIRIINKCNVCNTPIFMEVIVKIE